MKFRKREAVVDAVKWTGDNIQEVVDALTDGVIPQGWSNHGGILRIFTDVRLVSPSTGLIEVMPGEWVIKDSQQGFIKEREKEFSEKYEEAQ